MLVRKSNERGDTIIEVLLAMTILSAVLTVCMSLMNYGFSLALSSMDRTNVQALMNGQAALLHVARDKYVEGDTEGWRAMTSTAAPIASPPGYATTIVPPAEPNAGGCSDAAKRFYLDPTAPKAWEPVNASDDAVTPPKRVDSYPTVGDGMWIEAYRIDPDGSAGSQPVYYDFYIKSCWNTPGSTIDQEAKMVVRLYEN